jgi:hypothetical protein
MKDIMLLSQLTTSLFSTKLEKRNSQRTQIFGHSIVVHQLAQRDSAQHYILSKKMCDLRNTGALVSYLHNVMFIPTKSALVKAVKQGHIST